MPRITMLDVAIARGHDKVVGVIEENLKSVPEFGIFPARSINGTQYETLSRIGLPTASFTQASAGIAASKSNWERKLVQCFLLQSRIEIPKHIADASEEGPAFWQDAESVGVGLAAMRTVATQIYYGTAASSDYGFIGLKAIASAGSTLTTDATGTTATTASSCYFVKFGLQGVTLIAGRNSALELSAFMEESIVDSGGTNRLPGYVGHLSSWMGLQTINPNSISRIYNLTADSGKGLTDALIATHLAKIPIGMEPDLCIMSRRSRAQLQAARTVVINAGPGASRAGTGLAPVADLPTEVFGIPIMVSDSILNTDVIGS